MTTATPPANCSGRPVARNCSSARFSIRRVRSRRDLLGPAGQREREQVQDADREHGRAHDLVAAALAERELVERPLQRPPARARRRAAGTVNTASRTQQVAVADPAPAVGVDRQRREHERGGEAGRRSGVTGAPPSRRRLAHGRRRAPLRARRDHVGDDAVAVALDHAQRGLDQVLREQGAAAGPSDGSFVCTGL